MLRGSPSAAFLQDFSARTSEVCQTWEQEWTKEIECHMALRREEFQKSMAYLLEGVASVVKRGNGTTTVLKVYCGKILQESYEAQSPP